MQTHWEKAQVWVKSCWTRSIWKRDDFISWLIDSRVVQICERVDACDKTDSFFDRLMRSSLFPIHYIQIQTHIRLLQTVVDTSLHLQIVYGCSGNCTLSATHVYPHCLVVVVCHYRTLEFARRTLWGLVFLRWSRNRSLPHWPKTFFFTVSYSYVSVCRGGSGEELGVLDVGKDCLQLFDTRSNVKLVVLITEIDIPSSDETSSSFYVRVCRSTKVMSCAKKTIVSITHEVKSVHRRRRGAQTDVSAIRQCLTREK